MCDSFRLGTKYIKMCYFENIFDDVVLVAVLTVKYAAIFNELNRTTSVKLVNNVGAVKSIYVDYII